MRADEAARRLGLAVHGRFICCPSPDHEDSSPSCHVRDGWKCYGCGAHGDAIDLVRLTLGLDFRAAKEWCGGLASLAQREEKISTPLVVALELAVELREKWRRLRPTKGMVAWLCGRGLDPDVAHAIGWRDARVEPADTSAWRGLGFWGDKGPWWALRYPGVFVPVYMAGIPGPVLFRRRFFEPRKFEAGGKQITIKCAAPSSRLVGHSWGVAGHGEPAVIVEGEPDMVAWIQLHGRSRIVGRFGAAPWRESTGQLLGGASTWIVATHRNAESDSFFARVTEDAARYGATVEDRRVPESCDWADRCKS